MRWWCCSVLGVFHGAALIDPFKNQGKETADDCTSCHILAFDPKGAGNGRKSILAQSIGIGNGTDLGPLFPPSIWSIVKSLYGNPRMPPTDTGYIEPLTPTGRAAFIACLLGGTSSEKCRVGSISWVPIENCRSDGFDKDDLIIKITDDTGIPVFPEAIMPVTISWKNIKTELIGDPFEILGLEVEVVAIDEIPRSSETISIRFDSFKTGLQLRNQNGIVIHHTAKKHQKIGYKITPYRKCALNGEMVVLGNSFLTSFVVQ